MDYVDIVPYRSIYVDILYIIYKCIRAAPRVRGGRRAPHLVADSDNNNDNNKNNDNNRDNTFNVHNNNNEN